VGFQSKVIKLILPVDVAATSSHTSPAFVAQSHPPVGKNSLIMNNQDLILRKSLLTKNDAITQHK
jgi:hypothetical protein